MLNKSNMLQVKWSVSLIKHQMCCIHESVEQSTFAISTIAFVFIVMLYFQQNDEKTMCIPHRLQLDN